MKDALDVLLAVAVIAAVPLIFFSVAISGWKISTWAGDKFESDYGGMNFVGWIVYMTGCFWSTGLAVGSCALFISLIYGNW